MNVVSVVKRLSAVSLAFLSLLAACSQGASTPEIVPSLVPLATITAQMGTTAEATVVAEAIPTSTATPRPSRTPLPQTLSVSDQELHEDGRLTVERVEAIQPGWVVIHADQGGEAGEIIGFAEIAEGVTENLVIDVDPLLATPHLHALLHVDSGEPGVFEFPGPDGPIQSDSSPVMANFMVEISVRLPSLVVADQTMTEDEEVIIDEVVVTEPSWIALHVDEDGEPGPMLNYLPLDVGETRNLEMSFNWRMATPVLHAVLYEDAGEPDVFEDPAIDAPIRVDDQPIAQHFTVVLPPDIFVIDQPVVTGEIVVERVISYGPGWLVIYHDEEGGLGKIIGWVALEDGVNEELRLPLVESAVTPVLHAMIHQDLEDVGEFEFPRTDPPVIYRDRVPNPVAIRTDGGNYLLVEDQTLQSGNTITVPLVVVDEDAFVVIWNDEDGQQGEISGYSWVPAGVSRDVAVELDEDLVTSTLYAELHVDVTSDKEFDFPDGLDIAMQRNRAIIQAPFTVMVADDE